MSSAGTAGEIGGGIAGGAIGGIIGSFIPPPGLGTLLGRAIGSRGGRMAGRAAGTLLDDYVNSMEEAEEEAEEDEATTAAEEEACSDCGEPPKGPNRRHDPCKTRGNDPTKGNNTVWHPEYGSSVSNDVQAIQSGRVPKVGGTWTVNGRTYGLHNKSIHPISGQGLVNLSRQQHQVLKMLNGKGYDSAMKFGNNLVKKGIMSQQDLDDIVELWKKCFIG